jgi:hypothetical protein
LRSKIKNQNFLLHAAKVEKCTIVARKKRLVSKKKSCSAFVFIFARSNQNTM